MKQKVVSENNPFFTIENQYEQPTLCKASIVVSQDLVNVFFNETVHVLGADVHTYGFAQGKVPFEYVIKQYNSNIADHLKEFFFKFGIVNFLLQEIRTQKLLVAGDPRLVDVHLENDGCARFTF